MRIAMPLCVYTIGYTIRSHNPVHGSRQELLLLDYVTTSGSRQDLLLHGLSLTPTAIANCIPRIEHLNGTNFASWKDQIKISLGITDLDYALRFDQPAPLADESTVEQKRTYDIWERSNRMSLMIMKNSISPAIRGAIPDSENAKEFLEFVEEQFKGSSK
ncbi:uncharacterized protein [Rutidosis leptorrhynchoides]|uniref:uncharacterized protein n=1 Tax=Rutidosis leptorrhynchoides TaxID=125765 RepID=UPI003A9A22E4